MVRTLRCAVLLAAAAALAGADTLKTFDGPIFSAVPLDLTNQLLASDGLTFSSTTGGSCTSSYCGFVVQNFDSGGILIPSGPNYVNVAGNAGVLNTLTLNAPVQGVAFDLLGLQNASAAGFDGATIDFLNASNAVVGTMTINPVQVGTTNLAVQTVVFNSTAADITSIGFTKINTAAGQAMFGFDNLVLSSTAIPEPASVGLIGLGLVGAGLLRRRFNAR